MNALQPTKDFTPQSLIPEGYVHKEMVRLVNGEEMELVFNENTREDLECFGRMFIWFDYLPKEDHHAFVAMARSIKEVNQACLNDLEDYMIVDGMMGSAENYLNNRATAIEKMNELNNVILEEKKKGIDQQRPPELWNDPMTLHNDHPIRFSSVSILESPDPVLKGLYEFIEVYAEKIKTYQEEKWKNMFESVIGAFQIP